MSKIELEPYNNGNTQLVRDENGCLYLVEGEIVDEGDEEINEQGHAQEPSVEIIEGTPKPNLTDDTDLFIKWTHEATLFLLRSRFGMFDQFNHPDSKKRRLWEEVGKKLTEEADFKVDGASCDNKYRNLLNTYRKLKERKGHGKEKIKWAYFDLFAEYMKRKSTITTIPSLQQNKKGQVAIYSEGDENDEDSYVHFLMKTQNKIGNIEIIHEDASQNITDPANDNDFILKWSHEAIVLLLETRFAMKTNFGRPECKKKKLWEEVARKINEISTLKVDGTACDNKYRNLLNTYRKIKDKKVMTGSDNVKWPYFDIIDDNLVGRAYSAPNYTLGGSLNITVDDDESAVEESDGALNSRKRKRGDTIREVLEKKIKLNCARFDEKQEKKELHWRERKSIEEKKVNVLSTISNGLQQLMEKELNESYRDVLEEKVKVDSSRYETRQMKKEARWQERKELEERKIAVLISISDCLKSLTAKI